MGAEKARQNQPLRSLCLCGSSCALHVLARVDKNDGSRHFILANRPNVAMFRAQSMLE